MSSVSQLIHMFEAGVCFFWVSSLVSQGVFIVFFNVSVLAISLRLDAANGQNSDFAAVIHLTWAIIQVILAIALLCQHKLSPLLGGPARIMLWSNPLSNRPGCGSCCLCSHCRTGAVIGE